MTSNWLKYANHGCLGSTSAVCEFSASESKGHFEILSGFIARTFQSSLQDLALSNHGVDV